MQRVVHLEVFRCSFLLVIDTDNTKFLEVIHSHKETLAIILCFLKIFAMEFLRNPFFF